MLFLFGALLGLIGCFQFSRGAGPIPVAALILAVLVLVTCVLGAAGMGSAAGALVPAAGWLLVSVVLSAAHARRQRDRDQHGRGRLVPVRRVGMRRRPA